MGHWGQARVTGHEATRGIEQDRQTGTFALESLAPWASRLSGSRIGSDIGLVLYPRQDKMTWPLTSRPIAIAIIATEARRGLEAGLCAAARRRAARRVSGA
eukprot:COSAG06_NODE_8104_length_2272_cov_6.003221_1_plen_100_part_10